MLICTLGTISVAETAYPSVEHEFTSCF